MKNKPSIPAITARIEQVTPALAKKWLATMGINRKPKDGSVAMYASDMANGAWKLSPQGIAFDDAGSLFDGQHRLLAIIRSGCTVPLLVIRGFPRESMEVVDCGAIRSLPDRLKLIGCPSGNPNLVCAIARQIALLVMGPNSRAARRVSLATTLEIISIWAKEISVVAPAIDTGGFRPARNAAVAASFVLAAAAFPNRSLVTLQSFCSGANLDQGSPILELRNALISGRGPERRGMAAFCLSALLCHWHKLPGSRIWKEDNLEIAEKFFREKQQDRFDRVSTLLATREPSAV